MTNYVFFDKTVNTQQQQQNKQKKPCRSRELNPGTLAPKADAKTTARPCQLRVSIVVKPFNCFYAMGRNVNKQSQICGPDIFNKNIFLYYFHMNELLYLAVFHIKGSMFRCLNMVKM